MLKIPASPAELAEVLNDAEAMKQLWAEKDQFGNFIQAYSDNLRAADRGEMDAQAREQMQLVLAEYLRENRVEQAAPPVAFNGRGRPQIEGIPSSAQRALYSEYAPGRKADGIFGNIAEFFQATSHRADQLKNRQALAPKLAKLAEIQNSFGSEVPADGGFLIPEVMRSQLMEVALETAIVRPRATVIPMDTLRVPLPTVDDTSHVTSVLGGLTFYWTEEAAALTESQASFGRVVLDAKKLTGLSHVPNELIADAPAFMAFLNAAFPKGIAYFEDVAFFTGTGAGEPLGYVNCDASVQTTAEAGQPTATIVWENITKMFARMLPGSLGSAVWVAAIDTFPQLATMALSVGTGGAPVWLSNGAAGPPMTILGRPVYFTEKAPALGTTGDISFVDLSYYLIGDRMTMQSSSSPHFRFNQDQTSFRIIERLDGRPWIQSAITPHNNSSSTLSPFVQLASR
jgi:HK97 family phage major capsid protein